MNYPAEGLRRCYLDRKKKSVEDIDYDDMIDMNYSPEEIAEIKGETT
jgi:hypothetical protein